MAIVFVFTDEEEERAKDLEINYMRLKDTSNESLLEMLDDSFIGIFMPFLKNPEEREQLMTNFNNQIIMRKIWKGE